MQCLTKPIAENCLCREILQYAIALAEAHGVNHAIIEGFFHSPCEKTTKFIRAEDNVRTVGQLKGEPNPFAGFVLSNVQPFATP